MKSILVVLLFFTGTASAQLLHAPAECTGHVVSERISGALGAHTIYEKGWEDCDHSSECQAWSNAPRCKDASKAHHRDNAMKAIHH